MPAGPGRPAAGARRPAGGRSPSRRNPCALISPPSAVRAVDQPRLVPGPGGDQRGQRHPRVVAAGHRDDGSMAAAAPGAALRRPQALAGLVVPAEPGTQVRRRAFITGQVSSRHLATFSSSRSAVRRAGTCALHYADPVQQHIHPGQRVLRPGPPPGLVRDPGQGPALIRIPGRPQPAPAATDSPASATPGTASRPPGR
jgi:hypothetical protein